MEVSVEKPGSPGDILEHHGKKGMKWGVRNAYEARLTKSASRNRTVGRGGGTKRQKLATHLTTSDLRLAQAVVTPGKGVFKKAALNRANSADAHVARMKAGKSTTMDTLRFVGTVRVSDIVRGATGHAVRK